MSLSGKLKIVAALILPAFVLPTTGKESSDFKILERSASRQLVEWTAPELEWEYVSIGSDQFAVPRMGDLLLMQREGYPQVPVTSYAFSSVEKIVDVVVLDSVWVEEQAPAIAPSPIWRFSERDSMVYPLYQFSAEYKRISAPYPAAFVDFHSEKARSGFLNRVGIYPVKVTGRSSVRLLRQIKFEIRTKLIKAAPVSAPVSKSDGIRLMTVAEGVYSVTGSELQAAGIELADIPFDELTLLYKGQPVAAGLVGVEDGRFDPEDRLYYFADRLAGDSTYFHSYADTNVYWLSRGEARRFLPLNGSGKELRVTEETDYKIHLEEDHDYYFGDSDNQIHNTFDVPGEGWVWNKSMFPGSLFRTQFDLPGLATSRDSIYLTVRLRGTALSPVSPNHHAQISVNGNKVKDIYFANNEAVTDRFSIAAELVLEKDNALQVESVPVPGVEISKFYIDWFDIEYRRNLEAVEGYLRFSAKNGGRFAVSGFSSDSIRIWDVVAGYSIQPLAVDRRNSVRFRVGSAGFNDGNYAAFYVDDQWLYFGSRGISLLAFDRETGETLAARTFDTYLSADMSDSLALFVSGLPDSTLVLAAVRDEGSVKLKDNAKAALASLGSSKIYDLGVRDSWALIGRKGASRAIAEQHRLSGAGPVELEYKAAFPRAAETWTVEFEISEQMSGEFVAFDNRAVKSVDRIGIPSQNDLLAVNPGADYLVITHPLFLRSAQELADYRRSFNGFRTRVVTVQEIYDQFNDGIADPKAITRFIKYAVENWQPPALQYLLLFGDATWDPKQNLADADKIDYVPTLGNPVSDALFASLDGPEDIVPDLSVGRLPVETVRQAQEVIEKIRAYEAAPSDAWKKRFLFINGGFDRFEQSIFKQQSEILARDFVLPPPVSGAVQMINKESQGYEEGEKRQDILDAFAKGTVWVNFVGHAGSRTWDLMFHNPDINDLINAPALPIITSMTCHTGRFAEPNQTSFGENFVLVPQHGAIAFWGTAGWGYSYEDYMYLRRLYPTVLQDTVFTIGDAIRLAKYKLWQSFGPIPHIRDLILQYNLLGDPAIKLALPEKPDLVLTPASITTSPIIPTESDSSALVTVRVENYGLATTDSVELTLIAEHPKSGSRSIGANLKYPPVGLSDSLTVPWDLNDMAGLVSISADIDPDNLVTEADESNNRQSAQVTVLSTVISISSPRRSEQLPGDRISLKIQNPSVESFYQSGVEFQLDTTAQFNSDVLKSSGTLKPGSIFTAWSPGALAAGQLYYWRVRSISQAGPDLWTTSWFWTSDNEFGWKQEAGEQFRHNNASSVGFEPHGARLAGEDFALYVESAGYSDGNFARIILNDTPLIQPSRGINVAVFQSGTMALDTIAIYDTYRDSSDANRMADLIGGLPDGYIVCAAVKDEGSRLLTQRSLAALRSIGSRYATDMGSRDSWAIIGRKNALPGSVPEQLVKSGDGPAVVADTLSLYAIEGEMTALEIGPTSSWHELTYLAEVPEKTSLQVMVLGHNRQTGRSDSLLTLSDDSAVADLSAINAQLYPTLSLVAKMQTTLRNISPTLTSWSVTYDPVPDLVVSPRALRQGADSVLVGEQVNLELDIYNIGQAPVDSFSVAFYELDGVAGRRLVNQQTVVRHVPVDSFYTVSEAWSSIGKRGLKKIFLTIDEKNALPELDESNNTVSSTIFVMTDSTRPQIEITFDDLPVAYGELVSAQPLIRAVVLDNSPAAIDDTSKIKVLLDGAQVHFNDPTILRLAEPQFPQNAVIEYKPDLSDGDHVLEIFVTDASGNTVYQRADFRVLSELSLLNILTYPNPMKTDTQFTFTLTQPADVDLKIFTVAGRLIRELELGYCNAGYNVHNWDGLDQDGDRIANGVYLYIAFAKSGDKTVKASNKLIITR